MKMHHSKKINIMELLLRDGIQNEKNTMPINTKIYFAKKFAEIGFHEIEIGSFSHPKYLPQFNDMEVLLEKFNQLKLDKKPKIRALTQTRKAIERAVETKKKGIGPDIIIFGIGATEEHNIANTNRTWNVFFDELPKMIDTAKDNGLIIYAGLTATFGCPITKKRTPFENSFYLIDKLLEHGIDGIMPCDTTGEATPEIVYEYYSELRKRYPNQNVHRAHFHNNRGVAAANFLAAIQTGVEHIETSLGGIGGQPAFIVDNVPGLGTGKRYTSSDFNGNTSTEDMVVMLDGMGIETGLDIDLLLETGNILEEVLERELYSYSIKTGRFYGSK